MTVLFGTILGLLPDGQGYSMSQVCHTGDWIVMLGRHLMGQVHRGRPGGVSILERRGHGASRWLAWRSHSRGIGES